MGDQKTDQNGNALADASRTYFYAVLYYFLHFDQANRNRYDLISDYLKSLILQNHDKGIDDFLKIIRIGNAAQFRQGVQLMKDADLWRHLIDPNQFDMVHAPPSFANLDLRTIRDDVKGTGRFMGGPRRDVVLLLPDWEVTVFMRWKDFLGKHVMHCHNVVHEDHAMMIRWDIVPPGHGFDTPKRAKHVYSNGNATHSACATGTRAFTEP